MVAIYYLITDYYLKEWEIIEIPLKQGSFYLLGTVSTGKERHSCTVHRLLYTITGQEQHTSDCNSYPCLSGFFCLFLNKAVKLRMFSYFNALIHEQNALEKIISNSLIAACISQLSPFCTEG